ncbi:hypothetical protein SCHPADRAFT_888649 [Schizopora paradoxa]|uniref:Uncharacterized protein n=1 Tax=Schizopora paradoxa TaxID=27342 RepID=A0A0H2RTE1_9AGAM|nr:hypothetical protein SCHPADRAFT_888649 [Schizopora paradoxa]
MPEGRRLIRAYHRASGPALIEVILRFGGAKKYEAYRVSPISLSRSSIGNFWSMLSEGNENAPDSIQMAPPGGSVPEDRSPIVGSFRAFNYTRQAPPLFEDGSLFAADIYLAALRNTLSIQCHITDASRRMPEIGFDPEQRSGASPENYPVDHSAKMKYFFVLFAAVQLALAMPAPTQQGGLVAKSAAPTPEVFVKRNDVFLERRVAGQHSDHSATLEAGF